LKEIENFDNIDYEMFQKLIFFDERYFMEANSFTNPNNLNISKCLKEEDQYYTPISYEKMGISLLISVLDYEKLNPFSRIGNTDFKCIENLRLYVANQIFHAEEKYKGSAFCQNYIKSLDSVKKFESINEKIIEKLFNLEKLNKRRNSSNNRNISCPYYSNNIIINNTNNNYFDYTSEGNFAVDKYSNLNSINNNLVNRNNYITQSKYFMINMNDNNYISNSHHLNSDKNLCKKIYKLI
jgi:hypothetical protein